MSRQLHCAVRLVMMTWLCVCVCVCHVCQVCRHDWEGLSITDLGFFATMSCTAQA